MAYLARSLRGLRAETNGRFPRRDQASDGWLGDPAHRARKSDHNPDRKGCVHALDLDATMKRGMGRGSVGDFLHKRLVAFTRTSVGKRVVNYWIYAGRIYMAKNGYRGVPYDGPNKHYSHVHISVFHTTFAEGYTGSWGVRSFTQTVGSRLPSVFTRLTPAISLSKARARRDRATNRRIQTALNKRYRTRLVVDGIWGPDTTGVFKHHERKCGHRTINGIPDADSLKKLGFRVSR